VFAFEPLSDVLEEFEKHIKLNAAEVIAFNAVLGEEGRLHDIPLEGCL
jgi:hypothetical protein